MSTIDGERNPAPSGELQFDKAEIGAGVARACGRCQRQIDIEYFAMGKAMVCPACAQALGGTGDRTSFLRAFGYGAGAALLGTLIWIVVMKLSNGSEYGLIAIGVGLLVGFAVRKGSGGLGGRKYQALAMALTYVSITSSYVPLILKGFSEQAHETSDGKKTNESAGETAKDAPPAQEASALTLVAALAVVFGVALAAPFLAGASNIMGIFIIGIALYEAWKINRLTPVTGPFRVGVTGGASGATGPPQATVPPLP